MSQHKRSNRLRAEAFLPDLSLVHELRNEILDIRSANLNRWMAALSIGVALLLAGFGAIGWRDLNRIDNEINEIRNQAESDANAIRQARLEADSLLSDLAKVASTRDGAEPLASEFPLRANGILDDPTSAFRERVIAQAIVFESKGDTPAAMTLWRSIARAAGTVDTNLAANAWFSRGRIAEDLCLRSTRADACLADAIANFDLAVSLKPMWPEAYNRRASLLSEIDRHREAIADMDKALALEPDSYYYLINRASHKVDAGLEEGIADYDSALELAPNDLELIFDRGKANQKFGRVGPARSDYHKALRIAREEGIEPVADAIKKRLAALPHQ